MLSWSQALFRPFRSAGRRVLFLDLRPMWSASRFLVWFSPCHNPHSTSSSSSRRAFLFASCLHSSCTLKWPMAKTTTWVFCITCRNPCLVPSPCGGFLILSSDHHVNSRSTGFSLFLPKLLIFSSLAFPVYFLPAARALCSVNEFNFLTTTPSYVE